ncbi:hypothetical protein GQ600_13310 [Phytophthora cactorum]|nr:hypothetical protein GQ600_13310 [Phytophthora cactorum]
MEGREWHDASYEVEKRIVLEKLQVPEETIRASKAAAGIGYVIVDANPYWD